MVTWAPAVLGPDKSLTATLAVTVAHLPRGSLVVNERYGVRASEIVTPVIGSPLETVVPWRVLLVPIMRKWDGTRTYAVREQPGIVKATEYRAQPNACIRSRMCINW